MKKLSIGIVTLALSLGLSACGNDEVETTENVEELNQLESPAAGGVDLEREPVVEPGYDTEVAPEAGVGTPEANYGTAPEAEMDTLSEELEEPNMEQGEVPQQ